VDPNFQTELVAYRRLPGSQASYRYSRFPLSLGQPVRALAQVLTDCVPDKIERTIGKQLTGYVGDERVYYENLSVRISASGLDDLGRPRSRARSMERILFEEARQLIAEQKTLHVGAYKRKVEQQAKREFRYLIERSYDVARKSTEYAEGILSGQNTRNLREAFANLMGEYERLDLWGYKPDHPAVFIEKLSEFRQVIERGFSDAGQRRHELVAEARAVSEKIEKRLKTLLDFAIQPLRALDTKKRIRRTPEGKHLHCKHTLNRQSEKEMTSPANDDNQRTS